MVCLFVCLFVCLSGVFRHTLEFFSLIWRSHHNRWRATNFDLYSAFMAIEQWGFFSLLHPLWHGPTLLNGHLRMTIRDTHTCCRAFGRGTVTICYNELPTEGRTPISRMQSKRSTTTPPRRPSMDMSTAKRSGFAAFHCMVMATSPYEWKILEWDEKPEYKQK